MDYFFSKHSQQRFEQRGFSKDILSILLFFGDYENVIGNAEKIYLSKRKTCEIIFELKKKYRQFERN